MHMLEGHLLQGYVCYDNHVTPHISPPQHDDMDFNNLDDFLRGTVNPETTSPGNMQMQQMQVSVYQ